MKKILSRIPAVKIRKTALFAFFLFLPLCARSGVNAGSIEISPFLGYNFFQSSQNLNDNLLYGGRVSYNFSKVFALEGTLEFVNTSVHDGTLTGYQPGQFRSPIDKVNIYFYNIDAVFNLMPDDDFTLFVLGGFGADDYSPSIETGDMSTFDLGVGAKYWLSDHLGLRLDLRDNMVTETFYQGAFLKGYYQNINTTLGVIFAFGGEPKKKVESTEAPPVILYVAEEPKVVEKLATISTLEPVGQKTVVLAFEDVHFSYDKSTLSDEAKAVIKKSIEILRDDPKAHHIRIAGYTSAAGTDEYNMALSQRRAKAVEDYLIEEGLVSKSRLSTIGYGETRPEMYEAAPQNHYSKAAEANMRVLFEVGVK
jgi:OOP family OmpA-OmpF porin